MGRWEARPAALCSLHCSHAALDFKLQCQLQSGGPGVGALVAAPAHGPSWSNYPKTSPAPRKVCRGLQF